MSCLHDPIPVVSGKARARIYQIPNELFIGTPVGLGRRAPPTLALRVRCDKM